MATIPRPQLFCWDSVDQLGDLERLRLVLDALPDEPLMLSLEAERRNGRDDYPVRPIWNSLIAAFVFQHPSIAALRRELLRNLQLRHLCGFNVFSGLDAVPSECAYTRFQRRLFDHEQEVQQLFHDAADRLQEVLPDFGQSLAIDGKELPSQANGPVTYAEDDHRQEHTDRRREQDADWGVKGGGAKNANGNRKKHSWFGFLLHLAVDTTYELPVAFEVTEASAAEQPAALRLVDQLEQRHGALLERCEHLSADKGYDDGKLIKRLWDEHEIKPVIDIRNCWQDGEASKVVCGQQNVIYTFDGEVSCVCPRTGTEHSMSYGGFERDRNTLKYRCPARALGIECKGMEQCPVGTAVRIPLSEDRRVFTPVARCSYAWKDHYDKRSAVERVNSRLAGPFGFDDPFIRGLAKMRLRCTLALSIMLAMALGRIEAGQAEHLRSLTKSA